MEKASVLIVVHCSAQLLGSITVTHCRRTFKDLTRRKFQSAYSRFFFPIRVTQMPGLDKCLSVANTKERYISMAKKNGFAVWPSKERGEPHPCLVPYSFRLNRLPHNPSRNFARKTDWQQSKKISIFLRKTTRTTVCEKSWIFSDFLSTHNCLNCLNGESDFTNRRSQSTKQELEVKSQVFFNVILHVPYTRDVVRRSQTAASVWVQEMIS